MDEKLIEQLPSEAKELFFKMKGRLEKVSAFSGKLSKELSEYKLPNREAIEIDSTAKSAFLNVLIRRMLLTVAGCIEIKLQNEMEAIKGRDITIDNSVFQKIDGIINADYENLDEKQCYDLMEHIDACANGNGFDGKVFTNWSVRDIIGTIKNHRNLHEIIEELYSHC